MKLLIVYSTVEGHTRKIAGFLESILQEEGHEVVLYDAKNAPGPESYDALVAGSSIHLGQYNKSIRKYINQHVDAIRHMPAAMFTVCLAAASELVEKHEETAQIAAQFFRESNWNPQMHIHVPGAIKYTQYGFLKKLVLKRIAKKDGFPTDTTRDHEFTDWKAVAGFARSFSDLVLNASHQTSEATL